MTPNETCRHLSNGYRFESRATGQIEISPCCFWQGHTPNILEPISQINDYRTIIGNKDSYTSAECDHCNYKLEHKLPSIMRDRADAKIPADSEFGDATFVEIQIAKTCNAACIICNSQYSTLWQSENKNFNIQDNALNVDFDYISRILEVIDVQKTRRFNFQGGEGMLINDDLKILPLIDNLSKVSVCYASNGSYATTSDTRRDIWKKLQTLIINYSVDGIGDQFEYIRYPLKWNAVETNINQMCSDESLSHNFSPGINYTVNILNLYYYDEIENWYNTHAPSVIRKRIINYNTAYGILSPKSVTPKLFDLLVTKYGHDHVVTNTVVDTMLDTNNLLGYLHDMDVRRGLDWKQVFPEIKDCFD